MTSLYGADEGGKRNSERKSWTGAFPMHDYYVAIAAERNVGSAAQLVEKSSSESFQPSRSLTSASFGFLQML